MTKIIELKNLITKKENSEIEKILTDGLDQSLVCRVLCVRKLLPLPTFYEATL